MESYKINHLNRDIEINFGASDDHIAKIIKSTNSFYEIDLLEYLRKMKVVGECAIDVGANIGNHSLYFASFLSERVVSIEANPEIVPILEGNLSRNKISYSIVAAGAGESDDFGLLNFPISNNVGAARLKKGGGDIPITTIDKISPRSGVFLVKIDVEGMEFDVLKGARILLAEQKPHLVIEVPQKENLEEIIGFLAGYEYELMSCWNATPTYHFSYKPSLVSKLKAKLLEFVSRIKL